MTTRREVLRYGAGVAAGAAMSSAFAADAKGKSILILGGTGFIGPHLTQEAQRLGYKITHFNRGKRDADGVSGVETLIGDRKGQLDALRGHKWDVVVDNTGYIPKFVKQSSELLAPNVGYYLFVSSISAYENLDKPYDETAPVSKLSDPNVEQITGETYGPMKALCEQYVMDAFKGRASVVRPGYIVGPLDPTDRFTYWPWRATKGGEMLAPGTAKDPVQVIDVRDLAAWMMKLVEGRTTGVFNAISPPRKFSMGDIIDAGLREAPRAGTKVTWVDEDWLGKHWNLEEVDLAPWAPVKGKWAGSALGSTKRAVDTGLRTRPMQETVHDTLEWFRTLPAERQGKLKAGIEAEKEAEALKAFHAKA